MSESPSQRSPLSGLMLFMFCLAIAGSFLAGAHYYAVDLPAQKASSALPPQNSMWSFCTPHCFSKYCYSPATGPMSSVEQCLMSYMQDDFRQCLDQCPS